MKFLLKKGIRIIVRTEWLWWLLNRTLVPLTYFIQVARKEIVNAGMTKNPELLDYEAKISDGIVRNGIFKGMKYPSIKAVGSAIYPKLLGCYENELSTLLEELCSNQYTEIVDIGCAEGYYAVGLARKVSSATVFVFDTNKEAVNLCLEMADLNGVADRIVTGDLCDTKTLCELPLTHKALVISDCEGYEKTLFSEQAMPFLAKHEVLIEVHDFLDIEISTYLMHLFAETHSIQVFRSIDDIEKVRSYIYPELNGYSLATKKEIVSEYRPTIMEWFYFRPRVA